MRDTETVAVASARRLAFVNGVINLCEAIKWEVAYTGVTDMMQAADLLDRKMFFTTVVAYEVIRPEGGILYMPPPPPAEKREARG